MGLYKAAGGKCDEGLRLVDPVIRTGNALPRNLREDAFRKRWELYLVKNDYPKAIETCQLFNRIFPDSAFVDQALMGIAKIKLEAGDHQGATGVLRQVLQLKSSDAKAEARFMIAKATEEHAREGMKVAIPQYKLCAEKYPRGPFAGEALAKLVDYYVKTQDFAQANELLEQIFRITPTPTSSTACC